MPVSYPWCEYNAPMSHYPVPAQPAEAEIEVKKSRFIARAAKVETREQGLQIVEQAKLDFPDARHHCWAYVLGHPVNSSSAAMSDAGEPSGTAGKPILNVLQHKGVGDVIIVVIRYFGGVKLGAGGLVRAYSGAAQAVMDVLPLEQQRAMTHYQLRCDFSQEQVLRLWVQQHAAEILQVEYGEGVLVELQCPDEARSLLQAFIAAHGMLLIEPSPGAQ